MVVEGCFKVLLIMPLSTTEWGSKNAGGVDTVCQLLVQQIIEDKSSEFQYRILAIDPFSDRRYTGKIEQLAANVELIYIPASGHIFNRFKLPSFIWQTYHILNEVRKFPANIVHSHMASWLLFVSKKSYRIATLHGYKKIARKSVGKWNDLLYEKLLPKFSDFFVDRYACVGKIIFDAIGKDSKKNITVIGNPVSSAYFKAQKLQSAKVVAIVTCAVITPRKRIERAIELAKALTESGGAVTLKIIGPESDAAYALSLKKLTRSLGVEKIIEFTGPLNQAQIIHEYSKSSVGVFFSKQETFGLAPLEMLAAGLPLYTTSVGIMGENKEKFMALGVEYGADTLESISRLVELDTCRSRKYVLENYASSGVISSYESIYREII